MSGKSCLLEQLVVHAVPPTQSTNMPKITVMEMRRSFNLAQSSPASHEAKSLVDKIGPLLANGGFDIRQWASNNPAALKTDESVPNNSKLLPLSREYHHELGLIILGGRLRRAETLDHDYILPIILDPKHPITKLIIKHFDENFSTQGLSVSWEKWDADTGSFVVDKVFANINTSVKTVGNGEPKQSFPKCQTFI